MSLRTITEYAAVAGAGALGAVARLALGRMFTGHLAPVGTLTINVLGSFALAVLLTAYGHRIYISETTRLAIAVGFLGAFTTFSTMMWETNVLERHGTWLWAGLYLVGSIVLGLAAIRAGVFVATRF